MEIKKSFKQILGIREAFYWRLVWSWHCPGHCRIYLYAGRVQDPESRSECYARRCRYCPGHDDSPKQKPQKVEIKALSQLIEVIPNHRFVQTDLTFEEFDPDAIVEIVPPAKDEDFADDTIFITAETMPSFQDGDLNTFRAWVMQNVKFPQVALENRIQGRVVLSFVIDKDGRLTNIEVLQSPDRSLSEEAIRVLNKSPKWSPGKQRNQAVRVKYTLPVDFRVQN